MYDLKTKLGTFNPDRIGTDITRQYAGGRLGNLRVGYQEVQAHYSMGTPYMLKSITTQGTLKETILLCETCGTITTLLNSNMEEICSFCMRATLLRVETIYSLLVLIHALATRGIDMKIFPVESI